MALRRAKPFTFSPAGVSDTLDGTNVFPGSMALLSNLIPDYTTPNLWAPRPASIKLTNFTGFATPVESPSIFKVVGNMVYGLVPTGRNAGHDEPFAYNLVSNSFVTITGITLANTPITASTVGAWEPPTCDIVGTKILFTHPGFTLGGGVLFGWIDISTPSTPTWTGGNTTTNLLPSRPSVVVNFNGRAWYVVNPATGNPGAYFSDVLNATVMTNATQVLTFGDSQRLTAAAGLPLFNQLGGVIQSLIVFKSNNAYQITGDTALSNLALNTLNVATGTAGQRGITTTPQGLAFNAPDGIRICDFTAKVSEPIGLYGAGVNRPFVFALNPTRVALSCNANVLRVSTQNTLQSTSPWQEYWYDMTKKMWSGPHSFPPTMAQPWNNTFIIASYLNDGNLWQSDITLSSTSTFVENGTQLAINWTTSILPDFKSMAELEVTEHTINMILDTQGSTYALAAIAGVGTLINNISIAPPAAGAIWGGFVWGNTATWASAQTGLVPYEVDWPKPTIARKFQFQLTGNSYLTFRIGDMFIRMRELGYLQQTLKIVSPSLPIITSLSPSAGIIGSSVTISGSAFTGTSAVTFGGISASFTVIADGTITTVVPAGVTGTVNVVVTTPVGASVVGSFSQFTVQFLPVVISLSPNTGVVGTSVTISGSYFIGASSVTFGGVSTTFTVVNAGSITTVVPTGVTGTIQVVVTTPVGNSITGTFSQFTVIVAAPSAPVLILVSATTNAVFTIDVDNTIAAGDSVELQVQVTGGSWSPLVSDTVHTITAGEDAANQINLSLGLPNGSYDARALVTDTVGTGLSSPWSNTVVNFTISGVASTQIYFLAIEGF